ncbi:WAT1-related protein At3g30340-like isoform X3 [Malania oleifera]|uniref:WAT1-related protein At3g30340-like isoform X3 n=1 Tax=Malania oleifera TaxID=397392 RepID=UPI0025ADFA37|nr:WAT1-related protein At3g30340-like isoform X3 [Malania oleifera]
MELMRRLGAVLEACKPYLYQILIQLCLAIFLILVQIIVSKGISAIVIVVYEHVLSTIALSLLAFFLEKDRRPSLSFKILCYAFVLGLLQVTLCQMLLTMSLEFVSSTYQSVALNLVPSIVFALALAFKQEKLKFQSINGQAKIWGLASSAAGALALLLWKGPVLLKSTLYKSFMATSAGLIGGTMIVVGILASAFWHILVWSSLLHWAVSSPFHLLHAHVKTCMSMPSLAHPFEACSCSIIHVNAAHMLYSCNP